LSCSIFREKEEKEGKREIEREREMGGRERYA
jgi:hypothetical protein